MNADNAAEHVPDLPPAPLTGGAEPWRGSRRMLTEWLTMLLVATASVLFAGWQNLPARVDNLVYDFVLRLGTSPPNERILIVAIDNQSIQEYGIWPWPRQIHARLLDRLTTAGVTAIGYDVLFPEPGTAVEDVMFANALADNNRTVLPFILEVPGLDGSPSRMIPPVEPLASSARALGHVVTRIDSDGLVRGFEKLEDKDGRRMLHLTEVLTALINGDEALLKAPPATFGADV